MPLSLEELQEIQVRAARPNATAAPSATEAGVAAARPCLDSPPHNGYLRSATELLPLWVAASRALPPRCTAAPAGLPPPMDGRRPARHRWMGARQQLRRAHSQPSRAGCG